MSEIENKTTTDQGNYIGDFIIFSFVVYIVMYISGLINHTLAMPDRESLSFSNLARLQRERLPVNPSFLNPISVWQSYFTKYNRVDLEAFADWYREISDDGPNHYGLKLNRVHIPKKMALNLEFSKIVMSDFRNSDIPKTKLKNSSFISVDFDHANLEESDFSNSTFSNTSFRGTNLKDVNMCSVTFENEPKTNKKSTNRNSDVLFTGPEYTMGLHILDYIVSKESNTSFGDTINSANFQGANLVGANLSALVNFSPSNDSLKGAFYNSKPINLDLDKKQVRFLKKKFPSCLGFNEINSTQFPEGFNPENHHMVDISKL